MTPLIKDGVDFGVTFDNPRVIWREGGDEGLFGHDDHWPIVARDPQGDPRSCDWDDPESDIRQAARTF